MKMPSPKGELLVAVLSVAAALAYGFDLLGTPLRVVHVLTLVVVSMAAGVGLGRARDSWRARRTPKPPAP
jgi:hypothetical protein